MSFLKRAIRDGIRQGINDAVGSAVKKAIEPKATEFVNKTAQHFDQYTQAHSQNVSQTANSLEDALANLQRATEGYATEMSKNIKVCPNCEEPSPADKTFCPHCGTRLPTFSVAESALCPECGKQNTPGTKYCDTCGAKLPGAVAEEQAQREKFAAAQEKWQQLLPQYPVWDLGGTALTIEEMDPDEQGNPVFAVYVDLPHDCDANGLIRRYRTLLQESGFRTAGEYPDISHLYKMIDGKCHHVDTEHCFDGGMDHACIYFCIGEPRGGFDYVKPAPKEPPTLQDITKELKGLRNRFKF